MRFDPFNDIARFDPFRNMDDLLKDFQLRSNFGGMDAEPRIKMDVSETDHSYVIKAEIPGVSKEDIKVNIVGNQVSITAESKRETEVKGENMIRRERQYGQQSRIFSLANEINDAEVHAEYRNGVLEMVLPKKSNSGGKKIAIQ
jgi:HSP20 family protein